MRALQVEAGGSRAEGAWGASDGRRAQLTRVSGGADGGSIMSPGFSIKGQFLEGRAAYLDAQVGAFGAAAGVHGES